MDQDINKNQPFGIAPQDAPLDSGCEEEVSFCNCESSEQSTPYQSDGTENGGVPHSQPNTAQRLYAIGRESSGNPYIKTTCACRADFFKTPDGNTPIDTFSVKTVKACSLRTLALFGGAAVLMVIAVKCIASSLKD